MNEYFVYYFIITIIYWLTVVDDANFFPFPYVSV